MSCVCILTPVVIAAWPAFSAAVVAAANSLGYVLVDEAIKQSQKTTQKSNRQVNLEIANSEVVTGSLGRDQQICVTREGVTVVFSRDVRGRASVCVSGPSFTDDELRGMGQELSQREAKLAAREEELHRERARLSALLQADP